MQASLSNPQRCPGRLIQFAPSIRHSLSLSLSRPSRSCDTSQTQTWLEEMLRRLVMLCLEMSPVLFVLSVNMLVKESVVPLSRLKCKYVDSPNLYTYSYSGHTNRDPLTDSPILTVPMPTTFDLGGVIDALLPKWGLYSLALFWPIFIRAYIYLISFRCELLRKVAVKLFNRL